MTYLTNNLIENEDYNNFVWGAPGGDTGVVVGNNLNYLFGPGRADRGMNQDMGNLEIAGLPGFTSTANSKGQLIPVDAGESILARSWIGFFASVNRLRHFQTGGGGNITLSAGNRPAVGTVIQTIAAVTSKLTDANLFYASPVPGGGVTLTSLSQTKAASLTQSTIAAVVTRVFAVEVEWNSGDQARWFFNSGGRVRISISGVTTGSPANDRSTDLVATLIGLGSCDIRGHTNTGFTGNDAASNSGSGKGYWELPDDTGVFAQLGSNTLGLGVYSNSVVTVFVARSDTGGNGSENGALGKTLRFNIQVSSGFGSTGVNTGVGGIPNYNTDQINIEVRALISLIEGVGAGSTIDKRWINPTISPLTQV